MDSTQTTELTQTVIQQSKEIWATIMAFLTTNGLQMMLNLVAAAAIFFVGRWVARLVSELIEKGLTGAKVDPTLSKFARNLIYCVLLVFVITAAVEKIGVRTTSFVAVIGAAGLAVGLALQGSLSNFAAGVLLIVFKPFRVGDYIEAGGVGGVVQEIQIFTTILYSPDNIKIVLPNAQITGGSIKNYTANDTRRLDMVISISYGDDIAKAKQVITSVLLGDSHVLRSPEPVVAVLGLGESSVNIAVRPWVKSADYWGEHFGLHEKIKVTLEQNGLTIPFPQRDLHLRTGQLKS